MDPLGYNTCWYTSYLVTQKTWEPPSLQAFVRSEPVHVRQKVEPIGYLDSSQAVGKDSTGWIIYTVHYIPWKSKTKQRTVGKGWSMEQGFPILPSGGGKVWWLFSTSWVIVYISIYYIHPGKWSHFEPKVMEVDGSNDFQFARKGSSFRLPVVHFSGV